MTLRLTVIDQTPIHENCTSLTAPATSVDLAIECEKLGYHRFWLAEHHNSIQFAGAAPEVLITRIASATNRMRIGSGGVMLTHYSPYKVAETFSLLGGLFPGRIDLGIGRAPGGNHLSSVALAAPGTLIQHDHFPKQAAELCAFIRGSFPSGHPYAALRFPTEASAMPSLWMLGSGGGSSDLAGHLGMGLALAKFIAPRVCSPAIFEHHADVYQKAGHGTSPARLLALAVICAHTDEEASFIAGTAVYRKMTAGAVPRESLLSPSEVRERYLRMTQAERAEYDATLDDMVVGSPESCRNKIHELAKAFGSKEIGIVTVTYRLDDRIQSYRLLADAHTLCAE
ncbi:MsnO8 family LLM class oxidoreductase [Pseudomonas putida]|uniref:MsnO8 family LLM class oxidoreductase n=1 Tax=Pseudomonas putida TaxID=303 RepID=UPI0015775B75|nr:MsnO8 family LLM class oxidoreductase [Pseudomonas putida]NTY98920.1 MsnO8 family LLM class oxidoreductase [Pseudomonas putida]NTZ21203.1 MsnO8 family LLM class oxidoreductase [Pseudomonas putida]NTZ53278.1 MsnO8 family LLM class oxidoreductase [Pseudomonas putida]NTZ65072.1 MsnO8 family LLM class oxidoreductase [Pseudomonas putida]